MSAPSGRKDPSVCREDLVRKAARSTFIPDFDWVNDREAIRVTQDNRNQGLTAIQIRELGREWILQGGRIRCVQEAWEGYREIRHFHYDIIIENIAGFPHGEYVYMELANCDENEPAVNLLNAHPP